MGICLLIHFPSNNVGRPQAGRFKVMESQETLVNDDISNLITQRKGGFLEKHENAAASRPQE